MHRGHAQDNYMHLIYCNAYNDFKYAVQHTRSTHVRSIINQIIGNGVGM